MVALQQHAQGVIVPVRVRAAARRTGVAGERDGALCVDVAAAPEKGKANRAVGELLAEVFQLPKSSVELISGSTSSRKRFLLAGIDLAAAERYVRAALTPDS